MPRLRFARRHVKKFLTTPCEIITEVDTYDDTGQPAGTRFDHKVYAMCSIDSWPFFAGVRIIQPGGSVQAPPINEAQWQIDFLVNPNNPVELLDRSGRPFTLDVAKDRILANGVTYMIRGERGTKTREVTRRLDITSLATVDNT